MLATGKSKLNCCAEGSASTKHSTHRVRQTLWQMYSLVRAAINKPKCEKQCLTSAEFTPYHQPRWWGVNWTFSAAVQKTASELRRRKPFSRQWLNVFWQCAIRRLQWTCTSSSLRITEYQLPKKTCWYLAKSPAGRHIILSYLSPSEWQWNNTGPLRDATLSRSQRRQCKPASPLSAKGQAGCCTSNKYRIHKNFQYLQYVLCTSPTC